MQRIIGILFFCVCMSAAASVSAADVATSTVTKLTPAEIEAKVRTYFADIPVMIDIARCESEFRQFTDSGNVFYGGAGQGMVGIFQFYESIHQAGALALGFDLRTVEGNLGYARHLYNTQGTEPWISCVPKTTPVIDGTNEELRIKLMLQIVDLLQQLIALKRAELR